jgi:5'-3' exoribonuclease 2
MGVPKLFHTLIQQYHHNEITNPTGYNIIKKTIDNNLPTHFYLDFNGGIYQCIKPEIKTEESLILHTVEYLELLCNCIPNLEFIYIALDGIPPSGKISQQRIRRFHSVCRSNRAKKINTTFGSEIDKTKGNTDIDTNMITPGTSFMYNLSLAIKRKIIEGGANAVFKDKKVIFSDASIPGEGEHKLIHHIRVAQHNAIDGTEEEKAIYGHPHNTVIYALDGDLIFLSLSLHLDNMYLFREANEYGNFANTYSGGKKYLYMDIAELANAIITNFKDTYGCTKIEGDEMRNRYIDDYIFLGMLLGNDFMPKTHWFSIAEGGYERLLSAYWQIHNHTEKYLVDTNAMVINTEMLCDLIYIIKEQEEEAVLGLFAKRRKARIWVKDEMTERERQQMLVDFYPLQHLYVEQAIEPHKPNWRDRYYKICLHMENRDENRRMICQSYLKTLVWNFHYYFDECVSWEWVYNFDYGPTWKDIYDELVLHKNINISGSNKLFHFTKSQPIDQQTLLFMVLPWNSRRFMAQDIARKIGSEQCPMRIYFPKRYSLNVAFHRYYHECTPVIYKMEIGKVKKFIKDCKFTEDELKRNLTGNIFICYNGNCGNNITDFNRRQSISSLL